MWATYSVLNVFDWNNGKPINQSFISPDYIGSTLYGCMTYGLGYPVPKFMTTTSSSTSNSVCEYFE